MTRHIADKQHETGAGRIRNYTRQEREAAIHPAISTLHARPQQEEGERNGRRVSEFVRIERGHLA